MLVSNSGEHNFSPVTILNAPKCIFKCSFFPLGPSGTLWVKRTGGGSFYIKTGF